MLSAACDYGPPEIVTHGTTGWLVAPDDGQALAAGLRTLLGDDGLRTRLREGATRSVERFAINEIVARYAELLDETARA